VDGDRRSSGLFAGARDLADVLLSGAELDRHYYGDLTANYERWNTDYMVEARGF